MIKSCNKAINSATLSSIEHFLKNATEGVIVFDLQGKIIAANHDAARYLDASVAQLNNHYFKEVFALNSFSRKRHFIHIRMRFNAAIKGLSQHYTWIECLQERPIAAYDVLINNHELDGQSFIFVQLINVLPQKIIDWALRSLAKIDNYLEITDVIDEILRLASNVFIAEHAAVCLVDNQHHLHAVSYYELGQKRENSTYPFIIPFAEDLVYKAKVIQVNKAQERHPQNLLLREFNINSYRIGPIINTDNNRVGSFILCTQQELSKENMSHSLFSLFLKRINLEIARLLDQRKLQFLASIPQQDPNPILRILPSGQVIFANDEGKTILGYWLNSSMYLPHELLQGVEEAQASKNIIRIELEIAEKIYLFTLIWIEEFRQINIYGTDISQLKLTEHKMRAMARFDALTQIANRQYFEEILNQKLQRHQLEHRSLALLLIDLDNFKTINDTLGHSAGDELLQKATQRMLHSLRPQDFLARLGGDEFIVILNDTNARKACSVAEKIINVLSQPFHFGDSLMHVTASIGIAFYPHTGLNSTDLLKNADIAMYQAKNAGKNKFKIFSNSSYDEQNKRNEFIKRDLKYAVEKNQLFIEYQPQLDIIQRKIVGFEALLRWQHPDQGLILPHEFIPLAEQTGSIPILGRWLFKQSLQDYAAIIAATPSLGILDLGLSLNISFSQMNEPRLFDEFNNELRHHPLSQQNIAFVVSEQTLTHHSTIVVDNLKHIAQEGIKLCLDNFGSTYNSSLRLIHLPINSLKLDASMLLDLENNEKNRIVLKSIIQLAHELHIKTIQKGIETEGQHALIQSLGCRYAQGFYYCKPLKLECLNSFIQHYTANY